MMDMCQVYMEIMLNLCQIAAIYNEIVKTRYIFYGYWL